MSDEKMWTVRCIDLQSGVWTWYCHLDLNIPGTSNPVVPDGYSNGLPDQGAATVLCDALNMRDFGRIDPEPFKGYWRGK